MKGRIMVLAAVLVAAGPSTAGAGGEQARPDLKVGSITGVPEAVYPGHYFHVRVTVRNRGTARAGASRLSAFLSRDDRWDAGDVHLGGAPKVRSLRRHHAVTKQRRFKIYGQTPRGLYRLIVCADSREALAEQNEANNCHTAADDLLVPKLSPPILPPPPR